jgi:hypothetical protein
MMQLSVNSSYFAISKKYLGPFYAHSLTWSRSRGQGVSVPFYAGTGAVFAESLRHVALCGALGDAKLTFGQEFGQVG